MAKIIKEPTAPFNPFYGCAIMLSAGAIFVGIIVWSWYSLSTQDREIGKFTVDQPVKLKIATPDAAGVDALKKRLAEFAKSVAEKKAATLPLSIQEINVLPEIAPDTGYGKFTDMIAFKAVKDDTLIADVCFPLNKMKFWEGKRYAVGEASFIVEMVKEQGPDMKLKSLTIPGKDVNPGFLEAFSGWHWLTPYSKVESVGPTLKAVTRITVTPTGLEVSYTP